MKAVLFVVFALIAASYAQTFNVFCAGGCNANNADGTTTFTTAGCDTAVVCGLNIRYVSTLNNTNSNYTVEFFPFNNVTCETNPVPATFRTETLTGCNEVNIYQSPISFTLSTSPSPTSAPTTASPTSAPTTTSPTSAPTTTSPTSAPTTTSPTSAPTTTSPTSAPTTTSPTSAPTTTSPTNAPTTSTPTNAPTTSAPVSVTIVATTNNTTCQTITVTGYTITCSSTSGVAVYTIVYSSTSVPSNSEALALANQLGASQGISVQSVTVTQSGTTPTTGTSTTTSAASAVVASVTLFAAAVVALL